MSVRRASRRSRRSNLVLTESIEPRLLFSTFTVDTASDVTNPSDGFTTLREAVVAANAHTGPDTIAFASGFSGTIGLTGGQLTVTDTTGATTITAAGSANIKVDGNNLSRVFQINSGVTASITGLTITHGRVAPDVAGSTASGGGISNAGTLSLSNVSVTLNAALGTASDNPNTPGGDALGGGIYSTGSLTLATTTISSNQATGGQGAGQAVGDAGSANGGGIYATGSVTITGGTFSGNTATGGAGSQEGGSDGGSASGGAVYSTAALSISGATIFNNSAVGGTPNFGATASGGPASGGGIWCGGGATIVNCSISQNSAEGSASSENSGTGGAGFGGGIFAGKALTISSSTLSLNHATGGFGGDNPGGDALGGAIYGGANVTISSTTISNNSVQGGPGNGAPMLPEAVGSGGGLYTVGNLTLTGSTVSGNDAAGGSAEGLYGESGGSALGGGIRCKATLVISSSTISSNTATGGGAVGSVTGFGPPSPGGAALGGGIYKDGSATITNSTIANNSAQGAAGGGEDDGFAGAKGGDGRGGGIYSIGSLALRDSTISGNSATGGQGGTGSPVGSYPNGPSGAAVGGGIDVASGSPVLTNTIVSADKSGSAFSDIAGAVNTTSSKFNLVGVGGGLTNGVNGNKVGINNPKLQALGNYGGPTQTMRPLAGSPVLDAGSNALIPAGVTTDQRGQPRIAGPAVDIGSVELGVAATGVISGTVFNDTNANGVRDGGEVGLKNWKLFLDTNHNGKLDSGEPNVVSDASGNYAFHGLAGGSYQVREVQQSGWRLVVPASQLYNLTINSGGSATGRLFGNSQKALISGTVFNDANGNKIRDGGEAALSGWRVFLDIDKNGKFNAGDVSVLTAADGSWQFGNLSPGTYVARIVQQSGWSLTTPAGGSFSFTVGFGSTRIGNLFGERKPV